ncbi:MAG: helix-turn-helix domain-containing protein [Suipraeoptans sp.]
MYMKDIKLSLVNLTETDMHIHSGLQCIFMLRGVAGIEIDDKEFQLSVEDFIVINSNQLHKISGGTTNLALVLEIEREYLIKECGDFAKGRIKCHCIGHSDFSSNYYGLKKALIRMLYIAVKKEYGYSLDFKVEMLKLVYILYTCFKINDEDIKDSPAIDKSKNFDEILTYINDNLYRSVRLDDVAGKAFMSPQYFSKYFKKKTGQGFLEYITMVRLNKAVYNLVYTDESIVKIAMDNGFANAKAFNEAFKKEYNDTPGNFRKLYSRDGSKLANETDKMDLNLEVDIELKEFMQYVQKYDVNPEQVQYSKKTYTVMLGNTKVKDIRSQENIISIGRVETANYTNLYNQLEKLRNKLNFKYVYFELEYKFIPENVHYSYIIYNQFFKTIDNIKKCNMIPFIRICPSEAYSGNQTKKYKEDAIKKIQSFVQCVKRMYAREYINDWKIEVRNKDAVNEEIFEMFYDVVYRNIKSVFPKTKVGAYSINQPGEEQKERFSFFLHAANNRKCLPDFVTFGVFPKHRKESFMSNQFFYTDLKGYHMEVIDALKGAYKRASCDIPDMYMIEWNTLMGDLDNESILYFRSAIILDNMLEVNEEIRGAGYWADSSVAAIYSGEEPMTSLALHMIDDVKRPIYPVLELINRLGNNIIYENENILISKSGSDEYKVLIWNPRYLNPSYSLDESTTDSLIRNINVKLKGIESGKYQIKKITCNKEQAGVITKMVNAGYADFTDTEVFDYIKSDVANGLNVYDENIMNNTYMLNTNLFYNSVIMYIIGKKDK